MTSESGGADEIAVRFTVGGVIARSFSLFLKHPVVFGSLGILLAVPDATVVHQLDNWLTAVRLNPGLIAESRWRFLLAGTALFGAGIAISVASLAALQVAFSQGLIEDLRGRRVALPGCLRRSLGALPQVLVLSLIVFCGAALSLGLLFLVGAGLGGLWLRYIGLGIGIAAAILLTVNWWVVAPVVAVEGIGALASFRRSFDLVRGHRWAILALILLPVAIHWAAGLLLELVVQEGGTAEAVIGFVLDAAAMTANAMLTAVGYYHLRAEKYGLPTDYVAAVFD
jgi:hypothetical protein